MHPLLTTPNSPILAMIRVLRRYGMVWNLEVRRLLESRGIVSLAWEVGVAATRASRSRSSSIVIQVLVTSIDSDIITQPIELTLNRPSHVKWRQPVSDRMDSIQTQTEPIPFFLALLYERKGVYLNRRNCALPIAGGG